MTIACPRCGCHFDQGNLDATVIPEPWQPVIAQLCNLPRYDQGQALALIAFLDSLPLNPAQALKVAVNYAARYGKDARHSYSSAVAGFKLWAQRERQWLNENPQTEAKRGALDSPEQRDRYLAAYQQRKAARGMA